MTAALMMLLTALFQSSLWKLWKQFDDMFKESICAQHEGRGQEFKIMLMKPKPEFGGRPGVVEQREVSIRVLHLWRCNTTPRL